MLIIAPALLNPGCFRSWKKLEDHGTQALLILEFRRLRPRVGEEVQAEALVALRRERLHQVGRSGKTPQRRRHLQSVFRDGRREQKCGVGVSHVFRRGCGTP